MAERRSTSSPGLRSENSNSSMSTARMLLERKGQPASSASGGGGSRLDFEDAVGAEEVSESEAKSTQETHANL